MDELDPVAMSDLTSALTNVTGMFSTALDAAVNYRNRSIEEGFSAEAAEAMAVVFHDGILAILFRAQAAAG